MLRFVATALVISLPAMAEPLPTYSLEEALAQARDHHPLLRRSSADLRARVAEARIPRAQWFPQLGATAQIFYATGNNTTAAYLGVRGVDMPRIGGTKTTSSTDWSGAPSTVAALTVDQEVFDFGRIAAQAAVADTFVALGRALVDDISLEIQLGVEESYHAVLAAHEVLRATDDAVKRAAAHRDYMQSGVKSGMHPPIHLTRAQAEVAQLNVLRGRAQGGLRKARAAFAAAVGSEALEVEARAPAQGDEAAPALPEALRLAAQQNPVLAAAAARIDAQHQAARAITRELLPNLVATAGLSGRAGGWQPTSGNLPYGEGWLPDVANWHIGLVLQWNLFDAGVLARGAAAKAREEAARADLEVAKSQVTLAVQRSYIDLETARNAVLNLEQSLQAAQANQAQADARFRAGLGTVLELADAESLLTNAQLQLAVGHFNVARARASLGRAFAENLPQRNRK